MSDLARLARPFPRELIQKDPGGNVYVAHENVTQWLLGIVGPFDWTLVEIIRGNVPGTPPDPDGKSKRAKAGTPDLNDVIVGGVWRLTLTVDNQTVHIEEAGDVEDPHNWRHDGARLKQAASDAIKRCAMRAGLGLHLWAGERYVLDARLQQAQPPPQPPAGPPAQGNGTTPQVSLKWETGRDLLRDLSMSANDAAKVLRAESPSDFGGITFQEVLRLRGDPLAKAFVYLRAAKTAGPVASAPPGPGPATNAAAEGQETPTPPAGQEPPKAAATTSPPSSLGDERPGRGGRAPAGPRRGRRDATDATSSVKQAGSADATEGKRNADAAADPSLLPDEDAEQAAYDRSRAEGWTR